MSDENPIDEYLERNSSAEPSLDQVCVCLSFLYDLINERFPLSDEAKDKFDSQRLLNAEEVIRQVAKGGGKTHKAIWEVHAKGYLRNYGLLEKDADKLESEGNDGK